MYREDDDAPSARFRARFRRGARLDVMRPAEAGLFRRSSGETSMKNPSAK